ncbi:hypothetical protein K469DRAFT_596546 [Zopfia rhizophila CBS 207.26]|uniref:Uncharacterized protein n=1 Tax=Zopfia rhizophila CBS 207.26 TaxID=1314779 RepID=A0A6A6DLF2_9PEZI|nr:hypothetical protein K469DRAFT_596546 [Zopfia rhizophila CBS 207.26]
MHPCDLLRGEYEERGQTAAFTRSDDQKWYYLNKQRTNEVTLIKIWNNQNGSAIVRRFQEVYLYVRYLS